MAAGPISLRAETEGGQTLFQRSFCRLSCSSLEAPCVASLHLMIIEGPAADLVGKEKQTCEPALYLCNYGALRRFCDARPEEFHGVGSAECTRRAPGLREAFVALCDAL